MDFCNNNNNNNNKNNKNTAALVFSRVDYGNTLLTGLPHSSLTPSQHVINVAIRLVNGLQLHDHVTTRASSKYHTVLGQRLIFTGYLLLKRASSTNCACLYTMLSRRALIYDMDLLQPVAAMPSCNSVLRSATSDSQFVPRTRLHVWWARLLSCCSQGM